jgi:hypothetical protein
MDDIFCFCVAPWRLFPTFSAKKLNTGTGFCPFSLEFADVLHGVKHFISA